MEAAQNEAIMRAQINLKKQQPNYIHSDDERGERLTGCSKL